MKTACFVAALLLAGCGGGGDSFAGAGAAGPAPAPAPAPAAMAEAFFSGVQALLGRDADGEPVAVEGEGTPAEGLEPQVLN